MMPSLPAWLLIGLELVLLVVLVRQHGQALLRQRELRVRLLGVQQATRDLAARVADEERRAAAPPYLYEYDPAGAPLLVEQPGAPRRGGAPILGGLTPGSAAPEFALPDLAGRERSLRELLGQPLLLVFFDPRSRFCARLAPALGRPPAEAPRILLISRGGRSEHRRLAKKHRWRAEVLLDQDRQVFGLYRARGTPNAYLLDAGGRLASSLAIGTDEVLRLAAMDAASPPDSYRQVLTAEAWLESAAARDGQAGALDRPSFLLAASIFSGAMQELQQRWQQEKSQQDQSEPATPAGQEQAA